MLWRHWGPLTWLYYRGWPANRFLYSELLSHDTVVCVCSLSSRKELVKALAPRPSCELTSCCVPCSSAFASVWPATLYCIDRYCCSLQCVCVCVMCYSYMLVFVCVGLDNDTDELLDLMSRRDTARQLHSTPSPSSHPHSPPPHSGDGRGAGHFALTPTPRSVSESTTNGKLRG